MTPPKKEPRVQEPQVRNAADEKQVREAGKNEKHSTERYLLAFRNVMATKDGRMVINRVIIRSQVHGAIFAGSTNDTVFNVGKREIGMLTLADIADAAPDLYQLMLQEEKDLEFVSS